MDEVGRLLERLQQGVLALVGHRVGGLDHEHPALALEWAIRGSGDHALANLVDEVLGPARRQPDQVGVRRRVGQRAAARVVGVGSVLGEELRSEGPRRAPLARAGRPGEEIGVDRRRERSRERGSGTRLVLRGIAQCLRDLGGRRHQRARSPTAPMTRSCTLPGDPSASITLMRSGWRAASSS